MGDLELNAFLPLVADCLLQGIELLTGACAMLRERCGSGIEADAVQCKKHVDGATATATALVAELGYEQAGALARNAAARGVSIREQVIQEGILSPEAFDALVTPEVVCRLGMPDTNRNWKDIP